MYHWDGWSQMGGWGMLVGMGLFWVLVIVGVVFLVRYLAQQSRPGSGGTLPPHETPIDVLKKRYARGEISKEDYERIKRDIAA